MQQKINKDAVPQNPQRRSFFVRILGGVIGGWMAGAFVPNIFRRTAEREIDDANVQVSINPLAVPRTDMEVK